MKTENPPIQDPLIEKLVKTCDDRGNRAELRRFWSPATLHYAYPVLGRLGIFNQRNPGAITRNPDAITAALYAVSPHHAPNGLRVGQACRKLAGDKGFESFEKHFRRLLASEDLQEVGDQLHRIFKRLDRDSIALDYNRLLWNLRKWNKESGEIKTRWAMDFWQAPAEAATDSES